MTASNADCAKAFSLSPLTLLLSAVSSEINPFFMESNRATFHGPRALQILSTFDPIISFPEFISQKK